MFVYFNYDCFLSHSTLHILSVHILFNRRLAQQQSMTMARSLTKLLITSCAKKFKNICYI